MAPVHRLISHISSKALPTFFPLVYIEFYEMGGLFYEVLKCIVNTKGQKVSLKTV